MKKFNEPEILLINIDENVVLGVSQPTTPGEGTGETCLDITNP